MRFLELRPDGTGPSFELDPRLTLLRGLGPAERVALVGFVHSVAAGDTFDWVGTVEVHGVQMTLADSLELVGASADAAVIVEASTLMTESAAPADDRDRAQRMAHEAECARLADARAAALQRYDEMASRIETAAASLDHAATLRLDHADGQLSRAARMADRPDPWTGADDRETRLVELEALITELDAQLASLPSGDRPRLASAAATCRLAIAGAPAPDPEAVALAEAWLSLHQRLSGLESRVESAGGGTEAVAARLENARAAAQQAEDAAVPRPISTDEVERLEALHERLVETERRTGRAVRKGAARRDFDDAQSELMTALDAIGYPSWAAFRMGNGTASVRPDLLQAYEDARLELDAAELEWAELIARLERDTDLQSVLNAIESALEHATTLLGHDPYIAGTENDPMVLAAALRGRLIDPRGFHLDQMQSFDDLRAALHEAGAPGVDALSGEESLLGLAATWLQALATADATAVRLLRDRERAAMERQELALLGEGKRVDRLDQERAAVRRAERDVALQRSQMLDLTRLQVELHQLGAEELAIADQYRTSVEQLGALGSAPPMAAAGVAPAVAAVAARIPHGGAGPIPLVVLMGDAPASAIQGLMALPADVQIIVVGDGEDAVDTVATLGGACVMGAEGVAVS
ncbi:MAG: hypothetical protein AAGC53_05880 [Actinomycetota bacterium]